MNSLSKKQCITANINVIKKLIQKLWLYIVLIIDVAKDSTKVFMINTREN